MEKKNNILNGLNLKFIIGVLVIVLVILVIIGFKVSSNFTTNGKSTRLGFENVGKLVTQNCYIVEIEDSEDNVEFFQLFDIPFTKSRQIFSYDYVVEALVDFSSVKYSIDDNKKEIMITLPHATIGSVTRDEDSLKVYLDQGNIFSRIDLKEQSKAAIKMRDEAIKDCKGNGLLDNADNNAKTLISTFIKSEKKYSNYKVNYKFIQE